MPAFIDTHAHIQEPEFRDDIEAVVERALRGGVGAIVVPGVDAETSASAAWLADRFPSVYFAAGFHPHEARHLEQAGIARIRELLKHPKAVAVGEIGLDFFRMHSSREDQVRAFQVMLDLARETRLPVIVHSRDAADEVERALGSWSLRARAEYKGRPPGVLHYFSGDAALARRHIDRGFLISVHTSVTHPRGTQLRQVIADVPLESLVIETDSPYGAPQAQRGKRNEPAFVVEAAKKIGELKAVSLEEVARATSAAAERLFRFSAPRVKVLSGARA